MKGLDLSRTRLKLSQASLFYSLILVVLFADVLFFQRTLNPEAFVPDELGITADDYSGPPFCNDSGAVTWAFHPWNEFIHKSLFLEGEIPLWNPSQATGTPLAANFQSGVFSPLQWPFFINISDLWWDFLYVLRLLLAGIFTFMFLKLHSVSDAAAWLGGLLFMLSGYFVDYINMNHLSVELLIALCFFSVESFLQTRSRTHYLLAVVSLTLSILGGMPEATFFLWLFLGCYVAVRVYQISQVRVLVIAGSIFFLAALNSAILLAPGFEYILNSHSKHFVHQWGTTSFSARALVGYFVPYFFGPPGALGWHTEITKSFGVPSAIGITSVTLSLVALVADGKKIRIFFGLWLLFAVSKIFGFPGINLLGALPLFETLIFTKYLQPSIGFSIAVLAGFGFNLFLERAEIPGALIRYSALGTAVLIIAMGTLYSSRIVGSGKPLVAVSILVCILFSLLICLLVFWCGSIVTRDVLLAASLVFFAGVIETVGLSFRLHPPRPPGQEVRSLRKIEQESEGYRIFGDYVLFPNTASPRRIEDLRVLDPLLPRRFGEFARRWTGKPIGSLLSFRQVLDYEHSALDLLGVKHLVSRRDLRNLFLRQHPTAERKDSFPLDDLETSIELIAIPIPVEFSFPITVERVSPEALIHIRAPSNISFFLEYRNVTLVRKEIAAGDTFESKIDLQQLAGRRVKLEVRVEGERGEILAAFVPLRQGKPTLELLGEDPDTGIHAFCRSSALPLAYLVSEHRAADSDEEALEAVMAHSFRPERTVVLEGYEGGHEPPLEHELQGEAKLSRRTANTLSYEIDCSKDAFLVISQTFFPGWRATVNGQSAPLYHANYLLTALEVPEGRSRVILEYKPGSVNLGAGLTLMGILLTLVSGVFLKPEGIRSG